MTHRADMQVVRQIESGRVTLQYKTPDTVQGKVLAVLPWGEDAGLKTETVALRAQLTEDTARSALEDLVRRGMVEIDDRNYWRKRVIG